MDAPFKIAVIGAGHVGTHVASECVRQGLCWELVLIDIDREKARGHATDLQDAVAYAPRDVHVYEGGYDAAKDADIAVMAACDNGYENADRLKELPSALKVASDVADGLTGCGFRGIVVSISNPCDLIAQALARRTGLTVVGTGTVLDSGRFRVRLARALGADVASVQGYCLGEHGDSQVPALSTVTVNGVPLKDVPEARGIDLASIRINTVTAGWDIVLQKGLTEFGIGAAAARLIRAIRADEGAILPCSVFLDGPYGAKGVYASVPCMVGRSGARPLPEFDLTMEEREALMNSFETLKKNLPTEIR